MKTRIWHKPTNEWITDYAITKDGAVVIIPDTKSVYFFPDEDCVIQLSTGLQDKTGREIYCGDILSVEFDANMIDLGEGKEVMGFGSNEIGIKRKTRIIEIKERRYHYTVGGIGAMGGEVATIIGNVFENPELLKQ